MQVVSEANNIYELFRRRIFCSKENNLFAHSANFPITTFIFTREKPHSDQKVTEAPIKNYA